MQQLDQLDAEWNSLQAVSQELRAKRRQQEAFLQQLKALGQVHDAKMKELANERRQQARMLRTFTMTIGGGERTSHCIQEGTGHHRSTDLSDAIVIHGAWLFFMSRLGPGSGHLLSVTAVHEALPDLQYLQRAIHSHFYQVRVPIKSCLYMLAQAD